MLERNECVGTNATVHNTLQGNIIVNTYLAPVVLTGDKNITAAL